FLRVCLVWLPPPRPSVWGFRCDSTDPAANYGEDLSMNVLGGSEDGFSVSTPMHWMMRC
uniref:Uncharacterized protein n=1 Tax=Aegilops tauschii subsp. strangulata TaxID=200361 RepID=A0A453MH89_AEGTS